MNHPLRVRGLWLGITALFENGVGNVGVPVVVIKLHLAFRPSLGPGSELRDGVLSGQYSPELRVSDWRIVAVFSVASKPSPLWLIPDHQHSCSTYVP